MSSLAITVAFSLIASIANGQEDLAAGLQRGTFARAIDRKAPRFPRVELDRGRQGWVQLSYVVTTDGQAIDPVIEDSSGSRNFERAALKAVEGWKFEPATWDGQPVEQCQNKTMIRFMMDPTPVGASRKFVRRYKAISKHLDNDEVGEAETLIIDAFDNWEMTVYEVSRLWMLDGYLAEKKGDRKKQLASYRKSVANSGAWIEKKAYRSLLSGIVALELYLGKYSSAMTHYAELLDAGAKPEDHPELTTVINSVNMQVASEKLLAVPATLDTGRQCEECSADWQYRLLRRKFSFADVDGSLDKLEIRCDWKRVTDTAREGVDWDIPNSWGNCRLIVFGEEGTTFNLIEHPSQT